MKTCSGWRRYRKNLHKRTKTCARRAQRQQVRRHVRAESFPNLCLEKLCDGGTPSELAVDVALQEFLRNSPDSVLDGKVAELPEPIHAGSSVGIRCKKVGVLCNDRTKSAALATGEDALRITAEFDKLRSTFMAEHGAQVREVLERRIFTDVSFVPTPLALSVQRQLLESAGVMPPVQPQTSSARELSTYVITNSHLWIFRRPVAKMRFSVKRCCWGSRVRGYTRDNMWLKIGVGRYIPMQVQGEPTMILNDSKPNLVPAFHGTNLATFPSIFSRGLLPAGTRGVKMAHGNAHGGGVYTANVESPELSAGFCFPRDQPRMLVCAVVDDTVKRQQPRRVGGFLVSMESEAVSYVGKAIVIRDSRFVAPLFVAAPSSSATAIVTG